jgi:hypothetical protein
MRMKPETILIAVMGTFAVTGVSAVILQDVRLGAHDPVAIDPVLIEPLPIQVDPVTVDPVQVDPVRTSAVTGAEWFQTIRPFCNPVDVATRVRWQPAPGSDDGAMHEAACFALAGKIDLARAAIERLPEAQRYHAAGVVFNAGHPAADAGDEVAAGPLMELVVEYWANHYMALYHAGAAAFERGDSASAAEYLERFLVEYSVEDGWRVNALTMLETIRADEG